MTDNEIIQEIQDNYNDSASVLQPLWAASDLEINLFAGNQYEWLQENFPGVSDSVLVFNHLHKYIKWASGWQRRYRLASRVTATTGRDEETADDYSKALGWQMEEGGGYNVISDAFEGALSARLNFVQLWMDYRSDPLNGEIKYNRLSCKQVAFDPFFVKHDMSDCSWALVRHWLSPEATKSVLPMISEEEIKGMKQFNQAYPQDMRFNFMPQSNVLNINKRYAYDEYYRRSYRKKYKIVDRETGEMYDWEYSRKEFEAFREQMPFAELIKLSVPSIERHIILNGYRVFYEERPWGLDEYPLVPFFCYFNPDCSNNSYRFTSMTTVGKDSQLEINRRSSKIMDILDAQVNSGMFVKAGTLVRQRDAYLSGVGRVVNVKAEANIDTDIKIIPPPPLPAGDYQMRETLAQGLSGLFGINDAAMGGEGANNVSGVTEMMRQNAGQMASQGVFDYLSQSQKIVGDRTLDLMSNYTPKKIEEIIGKKPSQHFYMENRERCYYCIVEEGVLTSTQRQAEFVQLLQLRELGVNIPDELLLEKAVLQGKPDLIKAVEAQNQQAAQAQQQQMQVEQQKLASEAKLMDATATERYTRGVSNIGLAQERVSKAKEDRSLAELNRTKAIKEMHEIEANTIGSIAKTMAMLDAQDKAREDLELRKAEQNAAQVGQQQPNQQQAQPQGML